MLTPAHRAALADALGLRRSVVGVLGMVALVGLGERIAKRFVPIYLAALGGGPMVVAAFSALDNLLGALYSIPGGYAAHRFGPRRALLAFNAVAMIGFAIVALVPSWPAVLVGSFFFVAWSAVSLPATMGLISRVLPASKRTMGVSMHSLIRRIPMAAGPLIGGWLIDTWGEVLGVRIAFGIALGLAAAGLWFQQVMIEDPPATDRFAPPHPIHVARRMSPALRRLLISDTLIRFCEQIPDAFVVLWCMKTIAAPVDGTAFGWLTTIEMTTAVICYIPVALLADRGGKKPFVLATFVFFSLFPLVLLACQSFWALVGAFAIRGLKEFGEPTRKALILDLAPPDSREITFAVYYLIRDCIVSLAALLGGWLWLISPTTNLLTAAALGAIGTAWFAVYGQDETPANRELKKA